MLHQRAGILVEVKSIVSTSLRQRIHIWMDEMYKIAQEAKYMFLRKIGDKWNVRNWSI